MKTTLDLPDDLVKAVELRAVHQRRNLKDVVADLLREGLVASTRPPLKADRARITTDPETGLPLIKCRHPATDADELTPQRIAEVLLEQEVMWHHDASR